MTVADQQLDAYFGIEHEAHFDLETIVNRTKDDAESYESLAHYLFNSILKAHSKQGDFDFLNVFTWLTITAWFIAAVALVMVIFLRYKLRSLTLLLLARPVRAMPLPAVPKLLTWTTSSPQSQPTVDSLKQWMEHMNVLPKLFPVELVILLCLLFLIFFAFARMLYRRRKETVARTSLKLEIGNGNQSIVLPILNLAHPPSCFRFTINRTDINLRLIEMTVYADLFWSNGVSLLNIPLEYAVPLPNKIRVGFNQIKLLRSLLTNPHFVDIQVINGPTSEICELVVLRTLETTEHTQSAQERRSLYPPL